MLKLGTFSMAKAKDAAANEHVRLAFSFFSARGQRSSGEGRKKKIVGGNTKTNNFFKLLKISF